MRSTGRLLVRARTFAGCAGTTSNRTWSRNSRRTASTDFPRLEAACSRAVLRRGAQKAEVESAAANAIPQQFQTVDPRWNGGRDRDWTCDPSRV